MPSQVFRWISWCTIVVKHEIQCISPKIWSLNVKIVDPYVYYITIALKLYISIYIVDNMDMCKHHPKLFEMVVYLNREFEDTIGSLDCYVGLHICCNHELHVMYIDQTCHVWHYFHKFGYDGSKPFNSTLKLSKRSNFTIKLFMNLLIFIHNFL